MKQLNPEIGLEKDLAAQIYNALQGDVVRFILKNAKDTTDDGYWRSHMEGHCMKVDEKMLGNFFRICHEVQAKLGFDEAVDYYVTGDASINAFSIATEGEDHPHIVNINSELFNMLNEDELKFVIGHELGHLINLDTELRRLIGFVYPQGSLPPMTLQYKIHLHDNLAELVADRYGYLACDNLDACVTAFFKMTSGLDLEKMQVSIKDFLVDNNKRLDYFINGGGVNQYDHPVTPVRIQAINLFANARNQTELEEGMDELIQILLKVGNRPLDGPMSVFIATAGLIVANIDGQIAKEEVDHIIQNLSASKIFPRFFFEGILKSGQIEQLFQDSVNQILEINPGLKERLLEYMISVVLADRDIADNEVNFIYSIGQQLGLSVKEISIIFANMIQQNFVPSLNAIS